MKMHRVSAILLKNYYMTVNTLDRLLEIFYWPVVGLLLWGFASVYLSAASGVTSLVAFFIGATVLWIFFWRTQLDISTYILEDFWSRNVYNLFTSPLRASEMFVASVTFGLIKSIVTFSLLTLVAVGLYAFNVFSIGIALVPLLALNLWIFGSAIGMLTSGIIVRFGAQVEFIAWGISFGLQPLTAVFYPLSTLAPYPGAYHAALALPPTYVFEGMRAAIQGALPWNFISLAFVLNLVYLALGYVAFYYLLENSRKSGFLATQV